MSDLTQPITNPELAQAVADMAAQGFVVDPFGSCLSFDRAMMNHLVQRKRERSASDQA